MPRSTGRVASGKANVTPSNRTRAVDVASVQRDGVGAVDDLDIAVEHLVDPVGGGHRLLQVRDDPAERVDRPDEHQLQRDERDEPTDGHAAARHRVGTADQHDGQRDVGDEVKPGPGAREEPGLVDGGVVDEAGTGLELRRTSAVADRMP